jgi:hypothetical protein
MTVERLLVAHRRVSARLSRALRIVGCIAVPGYVPVDSRTGRIFMYRRDRRERPVLPHIARQIQSDVVVSAAGAA